MKTPLGDIAVDCFLHDYWQKKPLLIRNAFPNFKNPVSLKQLINLAHDAEVESRLVSQKNNHWKLRRGPFTANDFRNLPKTHWTLLVQGLNQQLQQAQDLLLEFNFLPYSRLDDVMASFATIGGGVGPHFDSYDVFLLQGLGKRRWEISKQKDKTLLPNTPLKLLRNFAAEQKWVLTPGDMLYLPPGYAHHGVALEDCVTYSIGFRAPTYQELATEFLNYLQDQITLVGIYKDGRLKQQKHPAQISVATVFQIEKILGQVRWNKSKVQDFLGIFLTEPKPATFFKPPVKVLAKTLFFNKANTMGIRLALKSKMLFSKGMFYINGERSVFSKRAQATLKLLADKRCIDSINKLANDDKNLIYDWYRYGYIELGQR